MKLVDRILFHLRLRASYLLVNLLRRLSLLSKIRSKDYLHEEPTDNDIMSLLVVPKLETLSNCIFNRISSNQIGWVIYNPTIEVEADGNLRVVSTMSNRQIDFNWGRRPRISGDTFQSKIVASDVALPMVEGRVNASEIRGLPRFAADARIYTSHGKTNIDVGYELNVAGALRHRIQTATFDPNNAELSNPLELEGPFEDQHEKNWMPVSETCNAQIGRRVYSLSPFITVEHSLKTGKVVHFQNFGNIPSLEGYRGGTPLKPYGGYYFAVIHKTMFSPVRSYVHRIVRFEVSPKEIRPLSMSRAFVFFRQVDVEFCSGIGFVDESALLGFGYQDQEAWLVTMNIDDFYRSACEVAIRS